ncbi:MAG: indolepyruvate ferredoxin oxidoreductase subunit alpha [Ruminococcaceae bacterium]|nr:indolepyruvate ferredoxin oxidoreductase subunit alpha [Oscillospiraceae bacterium]
MKKLMLGNAAVASGLKDAGCKLVSSYPGTPSTEITEYAVKYKKDIHCEWAPNEKVAMETAIGASFAGARAFCAQKHVGLNVAADPLFTLSYTGVNGGLVIAVADDPGMHSSQNEQDSRHYARAAKVLMLEPSNSQECYDYAKLAFVLSEQFDTPVLLRLSTRVSHSTSLVERSNDGNGKLKEYEKNPGKYVMMPAMAKTRHEVIEKRYSAEKVWSENSDINTVEMNDKKIGIIAAGITYEYAKEALGNKASYLKLGCVYPLPAKLITDFAKKVETLYVLEQLDPFVENYCKTLGLDVRGKEEFSLLGEYSQALIKKVILGEEVEYIESGLEIPGRPPVLCAGCPHRGLFTALKQLDVFVSGDIGCYTLSSLPPLEMMDTCVCMGASISALHGRNIVRPDEAKKSVAVIGDSTFMHSGILGLVNIAYNRTNSKVIVLDNSITGMTGHQQNPTTGKRIDGEPTTAVDLTALAHAVGIERVVVVDPYDIPATKAAIAAELEIEAPSLIISRRPCALLKEVKHNPPFSIDTDKCIGCKACMKIGCPAIKMSGEKSVIDFTQCVGCGMCTSFCKFDAIKEGK